MTDLGMGRWCPYRDDACRDQCGASPCALRGLEGLSGQGHDHDPHDGSRQGPWQRWPNPAEIGFTTDQDGGW